MTELLALAIEPHGAEPAVFVAPVARIGALCTDDSGVMLDLLGYGPAVDHVSKMDGHRYVVLDIASPTEARRRWQHWELDDLSKMQLGL